MTPLPEGPCAQWQPLLTNPPCTRLVPRITRKSLLHQVRGLSDTYGKSASQMGVQQHYSHLRFSFWKKRGPSIHLCSYVFLYRSAITFNKAATASWLAFRTSSPFTINIWSPCISLPSRSAMPPLTMSDTNTPVSFLQTK